MNRSILSLGLCSLSILQFAFSQNADDGFPRVATLSPPTLNSMANDNRFALGASSGAHSFTDQTISGRYNGKILVMMFYSPWCPMCRSDAQVVSDAIISSFPVPAGSLFRKNLNNVDVATLLVSTESVGFDDAIRSFAASNRYTDWSLDSNFMRQLPRREGLYYYRGGLEERNQWVINDRRRLVVIDLTNNQRRIIANQENIDPGMPQTAAQILASINSVTATAPPQTFNAWASQFTFLTGFDTPSSDADGDGVRNLEEFFAGTNPISSSSGTVLNIVGPNAGLNQKLTFRRAKNISGVTAQHMVSTDLTSWTEVPSAQITSTIVDKGAYEEVTATYPAVSGGRAFYQLRLSQP